jgi:hypothetical protein
LSLPRRVTCGADRLLRGLLHARKVVAQRAYGLKRLRVI